MLETAGIIVSLMLVWALFPAGLAWSMYKLEIESGGIEDDQQHAHQDDDHEEHHDDKMAA